MKWIEVLEVLIELGMPIREPPSTMITPKPVEGIELNVMIKEGAIWDGKDMLSKPHFSLEELSKTPVSRSEALYNASESKWREASRNPAQGGVQMCKRTNCFSQESKKIDLEEKINGKLMKPGTG